MSEVDDLLRDPHAPYGTPPGNVAAPDTLGPGAAVWRGMARRVLLSANETRGRIAIVDSLAQPGATEPRHVHRHTDEAFAIVTGEAEFWMNDMRRLVGPGGSVFIPRGSEHAMRVTGATACRHLVIFTPGGAAGFHAAMAREGLRLPEDRARVAFAARGYDIDFTDAAMTSR